MLIVAIIDLPESLDGTDGDAPDVVANGVLARVQDEAGYSENGSNPYTPAEVVVHAVHDPDGARRRLWDDLLDEASAATARGHGPLTANHEPLPDAP